MPEIALTYRSKQRIKFSQEGQFGAVEVYQESPRRFRFQEYGCVLLMEPHHVREIRDWLTERLEDMDKE